MLFGSDWLANFFLGCFLFGLIFTIASLVLSASHFGGGDAHGGHADAGGHFDAGGHMHDGVFHADPHAVVHADGHIGHDGDHGISWLNLPTILAFVTWFGGAGYLLYVSLGVPSIISGVGATVIGLVGGAIMFLLLAKVLWPGQGRPMSRAEYRLRGTPARVVSRIGESGAGEIVYVKGGVRTTLGARSDTGHAIERGSDVVIIRYERGMAFVVGVDSMLSQTANLELPPERPTIPLSDLTPPTDKARS